MSNRRVVWGVGVAGVLCGVGLLFAGLSPARAQAYRTPGNEIVVGTSGDDAHAVWLGVSHGGCARGAFAVAVGEAGCTNAEAYGSYAGVGLAAAESFGLVAVSDTGNAQDYCIRITIGCIFPGVAASGTGTARGGYAVSGTGAAYSSWRGSTWGGSGGGDGVPVVAASGRTRPPRPA